MVCYVALACMHGAAQWLQMTKNPPKISSNNVVSRVFPCKFQHFQIASVSSHSVCFIFKTCQIIADTSMIRQFHEFFNLNFGGFFDNWPNSVVSTHILPICRLHTVHYVTMNTVTDHFATRGKVLIPQAWLLQLSSTCRPTLSWVS